MLKDEVREELVNNIIPFWKGLRDNEYGGYYGLLTYDLELDKKAVKGCILNSRILWFFSNAYMLLKDESLLDEAKHAFEFMERYCIDKTNGGVYWSLNYDGSVYDSTKHTYNQAFAIYALSSYYDAAKDNEAIGLAKSLQRVIEEKCTDEIGYLEAFKVDFSPESNEKLSENGVMAEKTMNTLLHVLEAYTEYYRVTGDGYTLDRLKRMLDTVADRIYNPKLKRQEVFFDKYFNSIIDLHSYGHDIETSWLVDRACEVMGDELYKEKMSVITTALAERIYERAYVNHSLLNECEKGIDNKWRIWWVQAETVVGFYNAYEKDPTKKKFLEAAEDVWGFIKEYVIDKRKGSEWFYAVDENGKPDSNRPIVEEWKCPYHNGRMCMEIIKRTV
ncbi:MAG: AGE family epimerase/isomerase [Lachnospiraceae bacterium]|nr:AGE family epimerase/isomerase [Lachnospiraceae bacterium]